MCEFCDSGCSCHISPPCPYCENHIHCDACEQGICQDMAEEMPNDKDGTFFLCPDCFEKANLEEI